MGKNRDIKERRKEEMTREELDTLMVWLKATYPKKYKSVNESELVIIKDNFSFAYERQTLDEVMTAYRFFNDKSPFEPTTAEVKTYIAERIVKTDAPVLDNLPEHHYMRGRYIHAEAFDKATEDRRAGQFKPYAWYIKNYPKIEWKPWAGKNPPEYWKGIEYKGWERTKEGFVKPIGAPNKSDLTLVQLGFGNG